MSKYGKDWGSEKGSKVSDSRERVDKCNEGKYRSEGEVLKTAHRVSLTFRRESRGISKNGSRKSG